MSDGSDKQRPAGELPEAPAEVPSDLAAERIRRLEIEREQSQARIAELEHQVAELDTLYRATPVAFCVVDTELRYLRVNDEYARIVGHAPEEIIGRRMDEIVHERARDLAVGLVKSAIGTGRPLRNLELPGITRTNPPQPLVWLVNAHPILENGEVTAVIGVMQDVTEPKRNEQASKERLDVIDSLFRNAPVGLFHIGPDFRFERINEMAAAIGGMSIEEHIGKTPEEIHPAFEDASAKALRELLTQRRALRDVEGRTRPPSDPDNVHVYRVSIEPLSAEDGTSRGLLGTVIDVTRQSRAEQELKAANARVAEQLSELETLYEQTPMRMCLVDRDLRIVRANRILAKAYGMEIEEMVGQRIPDLDPPLMLQIGPYIERVLATGQQHLDVEVHDEHPTRPGTHYTWLAHFHPTFGEGARVDGLIMAAQNITPLKRRQRELSVAKSRLDEAQHITRVGSWEWDLLNDSGWWSDALYEIVGKSPKDFDPSWNNLVELLHPDDVPRMRDQIQATLEHDQPYEIQVRMRRNDLSEFVVHSTAWLERTEDGRPARLIGTCQEVTRGEAPPSKRR